MVFGISLKLKANTLALFHRFRCSRYVALGIIIIIETSLRMYRDFFFVIKFTFIFCCDYFTSHLLFTLFRSHSIGIDIPIYISCGEWNSLWLWIRRGGSNTLRLGIRSGIRTNCDIARCSMSSSSTDCTVWTSLYVLIVVLPEEGRNGRKE